MSQTDEEFLKDFPAEVESVEEEESEVVETTEEEVENSDSTDDTEEEEESDGDEVESTDEEPDTTTASVDEPDTTEKAKSETVDDSNTDYKKLYEEVMAPFKATGKMMEVRSPEEAQKLMKMGADYTRKMQEISHHRKKIILLDQNNIDDDKLRYLIDLDKKNPSAIQKLLKESAIDPLDIDVDGEVNYQPTVQSVSDKEVEAHTVLQELSSNDEGRATIAHIRETWDDEAIHFAFQNPSVFKTIHEQRESGAYAQIMAEMERQTTLGNLPAGGSILEKYNVIGNQLFGVAQSNTTTRKPIKTRVATHSSNNGSKAKAAGQPRTKVRTSLVLEDLMGLDDDAFLKAMKTKL